MDVAYLRADGGVGTVPAGVTWSRHDAVTDALTIEARRTRLTRVTGRLTFTQTTTKLIIGFFT